MTARPYFQAALVILFQLLIAMTGAGCRGDRVIYEYRTSGDNIWVLPINGLPSAGERIPQRLTYTGSCLCPDFSHTDSIAFVAPVAIESSIGMQTGVGIWVMPRSGGKASLVCEVEDATIDFNSLVQNYFPLPTPRWRSDGRMIIYAYLGQIFLFEPFTTSIDQPFPTISDETHYDLAPVHAPDKYEIAFYRSTDDTTYHLCVADLQAETRTADVFAIQDYQPRHGIHPRIDWSPDSKQIVFQAEESIWIVDVDSREVTEIARGHTPDWSFDGSRIVFADDGKLWSVSPEGGTPELVFEAYKSWDPWASCSRDGNWIATHSLDFIYGE